MADLYYSETNNQHPPADDGGAADFLQSLAGQAQLLASLHWLGKLHVLACIPLEGSVAFEDIADLAGVPVLQLCRVVRLTATAGFLCEPQPEHVAHTPLSVQFVRRSMLLDATIFLGDVALPTAHHMAKATRLQALSPIDCNTKQTAYSLVSQAAPTLAVNCDRDPKLRRQAAALQRLLLQKAFDDGVADVLSRLDWAILGNATIVDSGASSVTVAYTLARRNPNLQVVVQMVDSESRTEVSALNESEDVPNDIKGRVSIQHRVQGTAKSADNALVYILRLPLTSLFHSPSQARMQTKAEVQAHFDLVRLRGNVKLIILAHVLPAADGEVEIAARAYDLFLTQMSDNQQAFSVAWLEEQLENVHDSTGRLTIVNRVFSKPHSTVALQVQIEDRVEQQD